MLWALSGRDLVITVKLAQFLTERAQNDTNRLRILPSVLKKKSEWRDTRPM